MPYIGNTVQNQGFAPAVDYFNGDGTTVTFTLSRPVASVAQLTAVIENVIQNPSTAFTISGNQITFTSAPPAGTNNIWVEYTSLVTTYAAISQDPSVVGDITASGGYLAVGDFGNSYVDGTIVDYVTGNARITTGPIDDMTFYHGGTASRSEMMRLSYAGNSYIVGNLGIGTTSPGGKLDVRTTGDGSRIANLWNTTQGYGFRVRVSGSTSFIEAVNTIETDYGSFRLIGNPLSLESSTYTAFATAGTERMRIDASGRVTTPYQPAFLAYRAGSNIGISAGTNTLAYDGTSYNIGSCYNTSTYRFTAPVAGTYQFNLNANLYSNTGITMVLLAVNGSDYITGTRLNGTISGDNNISFSTSLLLNANDYVTPRLFVTNSGCAISSGLYWNNFSGYLIG